ncbi:MAG: aspartate 1-decarboxylase [Sulfuricurvum sp.]|uniref:aspartate 1-decarboxylase n=1 Tax=Sulfuricurvum sp. TaxID=2025608 RepID=UPI002611B2C7|nr:aspartate 1-decarboxylase [Sulfuricurvum sp.]MDD2951257.1 aspartate 1-decarboxylase [Sulfuricurvum sp.]MDD5119450.1 aspartate 1-decarboxylase [Sulfuricurvum sp.]
MLIEMLYSKIHRATVTDANLNYVGSITIDEELLEASKMRVGQKVEILNINNGERFSTYIILGERGQRDICLNGAAARKVHKGDKIIIVAYATYNDSELENYKPTVVLVDDENCITEIIEKI